LGGSSDVTDHPLNPRAAHDAAWTAVPKDDPAQAAKPNGADQRQDAPLQVADARPPEFSDEALALRFAANHAGSARFVAQWGRWLLWTGSYWAFDETMQAFNMARAICRVASAEVPTKSKRLAAAIASAKTVAAIISLARVDRRHAATIDQWDTFPWLLNTPGGIVDLLTGAMLPHDPERYMSKITAVAPGGSCPLWHKFLVEITAGDGKLEAFLQRIAGYSLTGSIRDHALFFAHGTGGNGKGVFLNTLTAIMADYAAVAPIETFIASNSERHPTDLASLRGARLVTAQETEQGRRWAESKIKALTGGDPIAARFMRQDFFTYSPQFKLIIAGNHKPGLRGADEAIRRRFNLVPFTVTIAKPDTELPEKLKAEWPGILEWAIEGCLEWQCVGLAPPAAARQATAAYLAAEDAIAQWLGECCCLDKRYSARHADLFASWKRWAEASGEIAGSGKRFTQALQDRGFTSGKEAGTNKAILRGLALHPDQEGLL
jgi:putative DNA primase/helicase